MDPGELVGARQQRWIDVAVLLAVCGLLFFSFLGQRPLWDIDEGMHAHTSKQMVLTGDWVTPTMNGERFYDKPPLFNWLVAISRASCSATAPPESPVPLPRATKGTPRS